MNGSGSPVIGMMPTVMPMLTKDWNANQTAANSVPLVVAVGDNSLFAPFLTKFVEGYRAKGMTNVEEPRIPAARHYVVADNPEGVADLIEQHAGRGVN